MDVSRLGAAIELAGPVAERGRVTLELRTPNREAAIVLHGEIRNQRPADDGTDATVAGVAFDAMTRPARVLLNLVMAQNAPTSALV